MAVLFCLFLMQGPTLHSFFLHNNIVRRYNRFMCMCSMSGYGMATKSCGHWLPDADLHAYGRATFFVLLELPTVFVF